MMSETQHESAGVDYAIGRFGEDTRERLRISEAEYTEAIECRTRLLEVYLVEERFDVVLGNYEEFEAEILRLALQHSLRFDSAMGGLPEQRRTLTRRVLNLLASCRYYHDQLQHSFSVILGRGSQLALDVGRKQSSHYDSSFAYRLMEELRNVLQHFIDPIRSISANHQRTSLGKDSQLACTVTPQIEKSILLEDRTIRRKLGAELEGHPDRIDIKPPIREYIELVADGHRYVRERLRPHVEEWDNAIQVLVNAYVESRGLSAADTPKDLEVCCLMPAVIPAITERTWLPTRVVMLRRGLEHRNRHLVQLSRRYATNQPLSRIPKP